jgi:hypothetical protein
MKSVWTDPERNSKISAANIGDKNPAFGRPAHNRLDPETRKQRLKESDRRSYLKRKATEVAISLCE